MKNNYPSCEKLKSKQEIALLFEQGKWFSYKELCIITLKKEDLENPKVGVSVSKRFFKKAVDRNRVKRLLREVYRLNKELYRETFGEQSLAMLFYRSPKLPQHYQDVETLFFQLCNEIKKS